MTLKDFFAAASKSIGIILFYSSTRKELLQALPKNSIGVEIGCWKGRFSNQILKHVHPSELHLIDPWKYENDKRYRFALYGGRAGNQKRLDKIYAKVQERLRTHHKSQQIYVHRTTSDEACSLFEPGSLDWVYIDGNHLYKYVKRDLENYWSKLKPGGFLAGDDYGIQGWWDHGVTYAVDEFIKNTECEVLLFKHTQWLLQKPLAQGSDTG